MTADPALDDKRVAIVNEHMRLENAYDFPGCVGVFGGPQYQLVADGELYHGADGSAGFSGVSAALAVAGK